VPFNQTVSDVWPLLPETVEASFLRIMIVGNVMIGEAVTSQQVAAYIEIDLQP
jgi:hypothetical protein